MLGPRIRPSMGLGVCVGGVEGTARLAGIVEAQLGVITRGCAGPGWSRPD